LLAGWGAFNVVEGVIDHQMLGIHHVRDDLSRRAARLGPRLSRIRRPSLSARRCPELAKASRGARAGTAQANADGEYACG
jgi:hypothetical protein